jgi:hypothetical protein
MICGGHLAQPVDPPGLSVGFLRYNNNETMFSLPLSLKFVILMLINAVVVGTIFSS